MFAYQHKEKLELVKVGYGTLILISVTATSGQRNLCCTCKFQTSRPQFLFWTGSFRALKKAGQVKRGDSTGIRERAAFFLFCISSTRLLRQWCKPCFNPCQEPKGWEGHNSSSLSQQKYQESVKLAQQFSNVGNELMVKKKSFKYLFDYTEDTGSPGSNILFSGFIFREANVYSNLYQRLDTPSASAGVWRGIFEQCMKVSDEGDLHLGWRPKSTLTKGHYK